MLNLHRFKSATTAIIAVGMTATTTMPILVAPAVLAQTRITQTQRVYDYRLASGTTIPVTYEKAEKIVLAPQETSQITLTVANNILSRDGRVVIPSGSEIEGQLEPSGKGTRFVARNLILPNGRSQTINANSRVVTRTEEVRRGANVGTILTGAAVGSAAATLISGITGDRRIGALEVLTGTGAGAVGGLLLGRRSATVLVVNPESDLDLTLRSDLVVTASGNDPGYYNNGNYDYQNNPRPNSGSDRGI